jgi:hypothetical protein
MVMGGIIAEIGRAKNFKSCKDARKESRLVVFVVAVHGVAG